MTPVPHFEPKQSRLVCLLALLLVAWVMISGAYHGMVQSGVRGGDFQFFYSAAQRLNAHEHLYVHEKDGATYVYAPLLALTLRPFVGTHSMARDADHKLIDPATEPEFLHAQKVWFCVSAGSLLLAAWFFARALRLRLVETAALCIMVITAFHFWPTVMSFGLGQANIVLVCALAGIYYADSRDNLFGAAAFIALGALIKTWFLFFILYLVIRRVWKAIAACGLIYAASLGLLFTIVGWGEVQLFIEMTRAYAKSQMGNQVLSQSIAGFAQLHFGHVDADHVGHVAPLLDSPLLAALTKWSLTVSVLAGLAYVFFRKSTGTPFERRLQLGVVALSLLLLLPYCTNEYLVLVLPVLWTFLVTPSTGGRLAFCLSFIAYFLLTRGGPYYPNDAKAYYYGAHSLFVSLPFFTLMGLWLITIFSFMTRRPALVAQSPTPDFDPTRTNSPSSAATLRGASLGHA